MEYEGFYKTFLNEEIAFTWRLLSLKEYHKMRSIREAGLMPASLFYYEVFNYCYVGNSDAISGSIPAGIFISIGELCMYLSGDKGIEEDKQDLIRARNSYNVNGLYEGMKRTIINAFPAYTPEQVDAFNREQILSKFVLAEHVLADVSEYKFLDVSSIMTVKEIERKNALKKKKEEAKMKREELKEQEGFNTTHPTDMTIQDYNAFKKKAAQALDRKGVR